MKPIRILGTIALATAMTFGYACGNKAEEAPKAPVKTAEEIAAEGVAAKQEAFLAQQAEYKTELADLTAQYTHTVAANEGIWGLVDQYAGVPGTKNVVDEVCQENGMKYLGLPPVVLRFEPMTPVWEDGKQVNCNLIYEGQVLDLGYLNPRIGELEDLIE